MTEQEAKERIEKTHCAGNLRCSDNCMHGAEYCEYSMARKALEKQIAKKPLHQGFVFACPCCNNEVTIGSTFLRPNQNHCAECGQKLDWSEV